ncbi:TetR/AcrR family transcriptional regulator [Pseudonocardia alaniniphila]|uniref:TetR/AcrR family transcriptional regulator n=1 Tax=Pseudonocardia alaniniphila TaxID=75291 RepID=A0ABS9TD44_9PSEU|nr:TetR/AcrR family transcriptional regulator [Pseudonocardia alaniniphila]MCH6166313.1 TetR/AcrR family transcriptional regulator [Pseudonocardia alaniniphila]
MTESTTRLRADARRNREQIITAAREVFLERGIHAPLEEIARRAGVNIATLYRRFPDRHTLVQQVALDNLTLVGEELTRATVEHPDAWGALAQLLRRLVELRISVIMPELVPGLEKDMRGEGGPLKERRNQLFEQMEQLTRAAQQEGQLRQGINPIDLWLGVIKLSRPLPAIGAELNELIIDQQLELFLGGIHAVALDASEPLRRQPLTLDALDRYFRMVE